MINKLINIKGKKAQEETVGFVVIIIIVAIIILIFLVFSLSSSRETGGSYKAESFLQSALAYTSSCDNGRELIPIDELIASCYNEERCVGAGEEYTCDVLDETLKGLLEASWPVGEDRPEKGYKIQAVSGAGEETIFSISKGNVTNSYKAANQIIPESGAQIRVTFTAYS